MSSHARSISSPWPSRLAALAVGGAVIAVLLLFLWGLSRQGAIGQVPVATRPAPDFQLTLFQPTDDGSQVWRLAAQQGRPVVVNFWASWCIPCEEEAAVLESAWRRYRDRVAFVGVDVQDSEANARAFLQRYRVTYPNGPDPDGSISIDYGMSGVPETYFISPDQRIVRKWAGPLDEARITTFIEELLR